MMKCDKTIDYGVFKVRRNRSGWGRDEYLIKLPAGYIQRFGKPEYVRIKGYNGVLIIEPCEGYDMT